MEKNNLSGKTYSLLAKSNSSEVYYHAIRQIVDRMLQNFPDEKMLLQQLQKASSQKKIIGLFSTKWFTKPCPNFSQDKLAGSLSKFTAKVKDHLSQLSLRERFDPIIATTEKQYHLFMLEIELTNRIYKAAFQKAKYKFALFPHCLRDFRPRCLAEPGEMEHVCQECNRHCFINLGDQLLKQYRIEPYISVTIDQKKLFKEILAQHKSVGALGIACIPELVRGLRLCNDLGMAAIGIPLDANRCSRWMGQARETTFSLTELENLVK